MFPIIPCLTLPLILHGDTNSLQQTLPQPLQSLVAVSGEEEALCRLAGDVPEFLLVDLSHPDGKHNDPVLPQMLGRSRHIIRGITICDDHSDLRNSLTGSAPGHLCEVILQEEFNGLACLRASCSVGKFVNLSQQGLLVHVILQQELLVRFVTVLCQADPNIVRANVEACDDTAEKPPGLLKVMVADA